MFSKIADIDPWRYHSPSLKLSFSSWNYPKSLKDSTWSTGFAAATWKEIQCIGHRDDILIYKLSNTHLSVSTDVIPRALHWKNGCSISDETLLSSHQVPARRWWKLGAPKSIYLDRLKDFACALLVTNECNESNPTLGALRKYHGRKI